MEGTASNKTETMAIQKLTWKDRKGGINKMKKCKEILYIDSAKISRQFYMLKM